MADVVPITVAPVPSALMELQRNFCLVALGGDVRVADRREIAQVLSGERDEDIGMYKMPAGKLLMQRLLESLHIASEPKKDITEFLVSPNTKVFDAVAFSPLTTPPNTINYWSGSPIEPEKGSWYIIQQFLLDIICDGDIELYGYLFRFLAHMLQHPEEKPGIIITLLGGQGTGKGTFFDLLRAIWPRTCLSASSIDHVIGQYNAALERNFAICMDEALFAGDRRAMDRLKSFVTEPIVTIEQKNQPRRTIKSYHRFFAASNHFHFAQVDADDRRFVFLRVSDAHQGDLAYWKKVHAALADPSVIAGLVHDLNGYELGEFNVRKRPKTREHLEQKLRSLSGFDRYWYQVLQTGIFGEDAYPDPLGTWTASCFLGTEDLMKAWGQYEKGQRQYATRQESEVHEALKRLCPSRVYKRKKPRNQPQKRGFQLPALPVARAAFERAMGGEVDWYDPGEAEA